MFLHFVVSVLVADALGLNQNYFNVLFALKVLDNLYYDANCFQRYDWLFF